MRKKYLSALLFGALLFASAGTFTSCKDYDDDINNLQEQINTVVSDLNSLKSQIENLGTGVSDVKFDEATGVLTVVDGDGTHTYTIKTASEAMIKVEIKDNQLYVNDEVVGSVVGEVKVENGKLLVDGNEVAEIGTKVLLVKDVANGICTLTVGEETVTLPMASATGLVSLTLKGDYTFGSTLDEAGTTGASSIYWGLSAADIESQGVKGKITKGQLLIGQIATADNAVLVSPVTYDLSSQSLSLRDSEGKQAPVTVKAVAANESGLITGSRAADIQGEYDLVIEFTDDVTKDNIAKTFVSENKNILYALFVNGTQYTGYTIAIKTDASETKNKTLTYVDANFTNLTNDEKASSETIDLKLGKNEFSYADSYLYDAYITFEGTYKAMAEEMGVTANGMTIDVPESAAGNATLYATINLVSVSGKLTQKNVKLNIATSSVETPAEAEAYTYQVVPTAQSKDIYLKVEGLFADMTSAQLEQVNNNSQITLAEVEGQENFIFDNVGNSIQYYKSDKKTAFNASTDDLNDLAYIKINDGKNYKSTAKAGDYVLNLKVKTDAGNELKSINIPFKVTLPSFDEMFEKSAGTVWNGESYTTTLEGTGADATISLANAFAAKIGYDKTDLKISSLKTDKDKSAMETASSVSLTSVQLVESEVIDENVIVAKTLSAEVEYQFGNASELKVTKSFTVNLRSIFEGAEVKYYVNGAVQSDDYTVSLNTVNTAEYIAGRTGSKASEYNGLAIAFNGAEVAYASASTISVGGVTLNSSASGTNQVKVEYAIDKASYTPGTPAVDANGVKVSTSTLTKGQGGTLVITFTDAVGIKTVKKINFVK